MEMKFLIEIVKQPQAGKQTCEHKIFKDRKK